MVATLKNEPHLVAGPLLPAVSGCGRFGTRLPMAMRVRKSGVITIRLNQNEKCFSCAREDGVSIYSLKPLFLHVHLDFATVGGVKIAEMYYNSNVIALVGGGQAPKFSERNVMIWDDDKSKFIYELGFPSTVLSIRMTKDRLFVILYSDIHIFSFPIIKALKNITTPPNTLGLCEVSSTNNLLVHPGQQQGSVQIIDLANKSDSICHAHQHTLSCISLNSTGTKMATASAQGTLIRIHNTLTRQLLIELRRGVDPANIYCLNFTADSAFLCAASDKGTVHIFAIDDASLNTKSTLSHIPQVGLLGKTIGSYADSQWGVAQFSLPSQVPCVCCFEPDRKAVVALCIDGTYHKYSFKLDGKCHREEYDVYTEIGNDIM